MGRRGDLLALIDGSPGSLRTLEGAVTTWVRRDLFPAGFGPADAGTTQVTATSYVVVDLPRRWRVVERGHVAVTDGERSWVGTGSLVTERSAERVTIEDAGVIGACLLPGRLLGALVFGEPRLTAMAGRACWVVDASPRTSRGSEAPTPADLVVGARLDALDGVGHRFWFDAATGIVLRQEGELDGERCATVELTDLRLDRPVGAEEFGPPPGAIVRSRDELLRDHLMSVGVDPDTVDLDDPAQVRNALRGGPGGDPPLDGPGRRDDQAPVPPGPVDPAAARAAIRAAVERLTEAGPDGSLLHVQAGHGLARVYEAARARITGRPDEVRLVVDDCLFLSADRAVVWYSVLLDGRGPPAVRAREGYAVRQGDRWLLERASFADLVGLAGVQCPPPDG